MTAATILTAATQVGVSLSVRAGTVYAAPSGRLPAELRDEIRTHKAAIVAALSPAPVACFSCRGIDFWRGSSAIVCRRCHPPAPGAETGAACAPSVPTAPEVSR